MQVESSVARIPSWLEDRIRQGPGARVQLEPGSRDRRAPAEEVFSSCLPQAAEWAPAPPASSVDRHGRDAPPGRAKAAGSCLQGRGQGSSRQEGPLVRAVPAPGALPTEGVALVRRRAIAGGLRCQPGYEAGRPAAHAGPREMVSSRPPALPAGQPIGEKPQDMVPSRVAPAVPQQGSLKPLARGPPPTAAAEVEPTLVRRRVLAQRTV